MDLDNVLNDREKQDGFSIKAEGNYIFLLFGRSMIGMFPIEEIGDLRHRIDNQFELAKEITDDFKNISRKIDDDVYRDLKYTMCARCGQTCVKLCKMAELMFSQLFYQKWMDYAQNN